MLNALEALPADGVAPGGSRMNLKNLRARSELGYAPVKSIDEGMEELARAHRDGV